MKRLGDGHEPGFGWRRRKVPGCTWLCLDVPLSFLQGAKSKLGKAGKPVLARFADHGANGGGYCRSAPL